MANSQKRPSGCWCRAPHTLSRSDENYRLLVGWKACRLFACPVILNCKHVPIYFPCQSLAGCPIARQHYLTCGTRRGTLCARQSPGEGYLSIASLSIMNASLSSHGSSLPHPQMTLDRQHRQCTDGKKQRVVLGMELVALLQRDKSRSPGLGVIIDPVGSSAASLPARLRASRLKLQQGRFRLDGRQMTLCDWR